jgi:RNA polymerase sigma-70 factor (ECF subfamily)
MHMVSGAVLERWVGLTDEDIVARVIQGQTALFEVLMRRHNERIYRTVRAILRDDRESEDVMQQAYVNAYAHLRQFDRRAAFLTWLTRIAVNEAILQARKQGRYEPLDSAESVLETPSSGGTAPDPERLAFARELAALMEAAVDDLPDGCREVFVLREIQGMSTMETADVLSVSEDVVKTRLSRAKATLRRDLLERAGISAPYTFTFHQSRCDRVVAAVFEKIGAS